MSQESFPNVRIGLMVGIGGGALSPKHDIRLSSINGGPVDASDKIAKLSGVCG
jgi:hypothetical protein